MATLQPELKTSGGNGRVSFGALLGTALALGLLVALVGFGLHLIGVIPRSEWWRQGPTLTNLVRLYLVDWPASWHGGNWGAFEFLRPGPGAVPVITAVLSWTIVIFGFMLPMVTYQIYALRKVLGFMQARVGPTQVGPLGLLQTPCDVLKLLTKEDVIPAKADRWVFFAAPFIVLVPASMAYLVIPFGPTREVAGQVQYSLACGDLNIGVLYLSAISSVAVIGIISAGWASNNKYSLLGAMRSAAQLVTYEVPLSLALLAPVVWAGTLNLSRFAADQGAIWQWYCWRNLLTIPIFVVSALAELGHTPFDLAEAESELVAGYNVEYSGMKFAMFFLAEFSNAFILSAVAVTLLFGGWQSPFPDSWGPLGWDGGVFGMFWFFAKTLAMIFGLFWVRATLPRMRIDQLMGLGWKFMIPLGLANLLLVAVLRLLVG